MPKLIIYINARPRTQGLKIREFQWSPEHSLHIYMGRVYDASEFNAAMDKALKNNRDLNPIVKVVDAGASAPVAPEAPVLQPPPIVSPVATISAKEVTVEAAVEVLLRLAPEMLRKKATKPAAQAEPLAV